MTIPSGGMDLAQFSTPERVALLLRDLIHERIGVYFEPSRFDTMLEKLETRVRERGCQSYLDYFYILKYDENAHVEWREVMNAYSVQETYFWRESDQLEALINHVVPAWFRQTDETLRIWSAACATGEEPYSIAMALQEAGLAHRPIEIMASDASELALSKARIAQYRERSFRTLSPAMRQKYFVPVGDQWKLRTEMLPPVQFFWANLLALPDVSEVPSRVPVVFCRNVFIYFSHAAIQRVARLFAERIPPGGHLFIGASESLNKISTDFELTELGSAFVYRRVQR